MRHRHQGVAVLATVAFVAILAGCARDTLTGPDLSPSAQPAFTLVDVNPNSPRGGQAVAVRDYVGWVSAWYFGHAT